MNAPVDASSDLILERMMTLHPKIIDLTLDRMWRLLGELGNPQDRLPPVIHVAGTNGKGSTLAMIRAGLEGAGLLPHVYTSPHLARFHERVRLAGKLISEPDLMAVLEECYVANGDVPITFFEITTCAAMLAFSRVPADYTLLEVGLGGRLDATNVIPAPRLTIIAPVSMDHEQFLGDTLPAIAGEKAGIMKPGVPCVIGAQVPEALAVMEARAAEIGAPLLVQGRDWHVAREGDHVVYRGPRGSRMLPIPNLRGPHQIGNAGMAVAALEVLGLGEDAVQAAVTRAEWPARMQHLTGGALVDMVPGNELWLDGGHNPAAGEAIGALLTELPPRPTWLVCGMLNTKDSGGFLRPFVSHAAGLVAVPIPGEPNSLPAGQVAGIARAEGLDAEVAPDVRAALRLLHGRDPAARILICGSLYLAGSVLRENI
ncbi:bifunctional folylpolyglutamate synthase/dihydrofolate synthase [Pontibaca methylaminivorans]|uniref:Dihydrofolate synthase/folylpolyglutamate synthase n=1 Tax=Pontibaca methylaminivorans TaxID=515897 RepID=A0A1R3WSX0_9RHOB|nr:folylpolyglutamate synthase/dihydrofolate synthase family protein [Pontibaca methylaminivorans]SIT80391.1 dihydrofolate synthase / folylpolyglutamate synthase [Pontibaca methylaminivorans]